MEKLDEFQSWFVEHFPQSWQDIIWRRGFEPAFERDEHGTMIDFVLVTNGRAYRGSNLLKLEALARKKNAESFKKSFSEMLNG